jgi:uncharacterized protein involved in exopolysaccharide biosynthesis
MTPGPVDAYLSRLERELRRRGIEDARVVEEAREHLLDAVEDGRQRGLSMEDAAREAFERFGAPEAVAAQVFRQGDHMMTRVVAVLETVWRRKWWILAPTVLTAVVTSVMTYYFLPTRYRSESVIRIVAPRVPAEYVRPTSIESPSARLEIIKQVAFSRTRLEKIIRDVGLYNDGRESAALLDLIRQMRSGINVTFLAPDTARGDGFEEFSVSFVSADPELAMKITSRLASAIIEENMRLRAVDAQITTEFVRGQTEDVRKRIVEYEKSLEDLRAKNGRRPLSQADVLPYEALQERYKALLIMAEESGVAANLERRQVGEQFKVVETPRRPERPVGPSRLGVNVVGTLAGLSLGLVFVGVRGRSKEKSGETSA